MVKARSPGPIYRLPPTIGFVDHDCSKLRNPQFTMSPKLDPGLRGTIGPGPIYQVRGFTEHGKNTQPAYSLVSRHADITKYVVPGPGAHSPEKCLRMKEPRPPIFTMRPKLNYQFETIGPGPLAYSLPSMLGPKVPNKQVNGAYTISPRVNTVDKRTSPGPIYLPPHTDMYMNKAPRYTMRPATESTFKTVSPGPAQYSLNILPGKTAPAYSMGRIYNDNVSPYITTQDMVPCKKK